MERFVELDVVRGISLIAMVLYHFFFDLEFFNIFAVGISSGFWFWFARSIAGTFVFVAGISMAISFARAKNRLTEKQLIKKNFFRGLKVFSIGIGITFVTFIFLPQNFIVFGILHLMGTSIILSYPFLKIEKEKFIALIGISIVFFGIFLNFFTFDFPWLLWLGFVPQNFSSVDFEPLLPWFGIFLIGIFFGKKFYPNGKRGLEINLKENFFTKILTFFGKNSLKIYLIHQLILLAIIKLLFGKGFF